MDIRDFLRLLRNTSGPNASGEYMARCPCHDDKTASLSVTVKPSPKDGRERIYFHCQAGCSYQGILDALGLKPRDLVVSADAGSAEQPPVRRQAPAPARRGHQSDPDPEKPKIDFAHPDRVYSYTDENGKELFQVCRYQYTTADGKREKTFRQRRYDPQNEKANRDGWVNSVPPEIRDETLYRMPQLMAAIREGRPVYVVEGEKDVETLERLGHTATCNPGGAGKWREGYTRLLRDADAIILPDNDTAANDYTGQNHALTVALQLKKVARRVRLVNIQEACPDLPPKGDITDMVEILGDTEAMDALARQVASTKDFDPSDVPFWLSPIEQAEALYEQVQGYGVVDGCIVQYQQNGTKALTDFVVIPRMELIRDDGINQNLFFVLDGWTSTEKKLGRVAISSKDLDSMGWVTSKWGFAANLAPGSANKDKVAWAIKKVGQMTAKRVTEYNHTGWRRIGGKWCYLYHGGAVGAEGITVDMGDSLKTYRLDGSGAQGFEQITYQEAARQSLRLQEVMKEEIGIGLLGAAYLAPLREFMTQTDVVPAFALFLYGNTQTRKSTAAALALSHYGNFHAKNLPGSFNDTANKIRLPAFLLKDMLFVVDDYHPVASQQERRQMAATAQALSRAFGDGADRGRLNADGSIKASKPPRCIAVITGEDLPAIGASGLARFFIVDVDKGDIPVTERLTDLQEKARQGYLQKAMRGYIKWLEKQADQLPERLHDLFIHFRQDALKTGDGLQGRAPETIACILIGYSMMLNYMRDVEAIDNEQARKMLVHARRVLTESSQRQSKSMESEKPTRIFLDSLVELLASKAVMLKDLNAGGDGKVPPNVDMVGYMDADFYYLLPNVAFGAVSRLCREQGVEFPVSLKALYKHLRTDGVLPVNPDSDMPTRNKWIDGGAKRLLWIPRTVMDGPRTCQEQTNLFIPVEDEEHPFDAQ